MALTEAGLKAKLASVFSDVILDDIEEEDIREKVGTNLDKFTTVLARSIVEYVTANAVVNVTSISNNGVPVPNYTGTGTLS